MAINARTWMVVVNARTENLMEEAWQQFEAEYSDEAFRPVVTYIKNEWLNDFTRRRFLHCFTNSYLHLDNVATSRGESAHAALKADLNVERTITYQHQQIEENLATERISKPTHLLTPLYARVLSKVSGFALRKVAAIQRQYLPLGPGKKIIPVECTNVTRRTVGIPCIHTIKLEFDLQQSLEMGGFHEHWHLHTAIELPPIDPRDIILEPSVVRARGLASTQALTRTSPTPPPSGMRA